MPRMYSTRRGQKRSVESPRARSIASCKPFDVDAGDQTQVFCKSNQCSFCFLFFWKGMENREKGGREMGGEGGSEGSQLVFLTEEPSL